MRLCFINKLVSKRCVQQKHFLIKDRKKRELKREIPEQCQNAARHTNYCFVHKLLLEKKRNDMNCFKVLSFYLLYRKQQAIS